MSEKCAFDLMCRLGEKINVTEWCRHVDVHTENLEDFSHVPCEISFRVEDEKGNSISKTETRGDSKWTYGSKNNDIEKYTTFKEIDITPGCRVDFRDSKTGNLIGVQYGTGLGASKIDIESDYLEVYRDNRKCMNALALTNHVCKDVRDKGYDDNCLNNLK